jgi:proteasome lid subunit RPN8/RPN11
MKNISDKFKRFMEKLFLLEAPKFSRISIKQSVVDNIIDFAKANYPHEFIAILSGQAKDEKLTINSLIYQPYNSSEKSSWVRINIPSMSNVIGSVHSHPSSSLKPSNADLQFFNKNGVVHMIIGYPYRPQDIACYDSSGNRQNFEIDKD